MPILCWADDREMCQASASSTSDRRCPIVASWCVVLGSLVHFHVCAEHALILVQKGRPYSRVRRIEECPQPNHEPPPSEGLRLV